MVHSDPLTFSPLTCSNQPVLLGVIVLKWQVILLSYFWGILLLVQSQFGFSFISIFSPDGYSIASLTALNDIHKLMVSKFILLARPLPWIQNHILKYYLLVISIWTFNGHHLKNYGFWMLVWNPKPVVLQKYSHSNIWHYIHSFFFSVRNPGVISDSSFSLILYIPIQHIFWIWSYSSLITVLWLAVQPPHSSRTPFHNYSQIT